MREPRAKSQIDLREQVLEGLRDWERKQQALIDQRIIDAMVGNSVSQGDEPLRRQPGDELTYFEVPNFMSRSRGRGSKPKSRSQVKPRAQAQPFMMFQIFDGHPWMQVRWDPQTVPKGLDTDSMTRELVAVINKHMAARGDQVRVSGVPYAVDPADIKANGADPIGQADAEHEPESRPDYPY